MASEAIRGQKSNKFRLGETIRVKKVCFTTVIHILLEFFLSFLWFGYLKNFSRFAVLLWLWAKLKVLEDGKFLKVGRKPVATVV